MDKWCKRPVERNGWADEEEIGLRVGKGQVGIWRQVGVSQFIRCSCYVVLVYTIACAPILFNISILRTFVYTGSRPLSIKMY